MSVPTANLFRYRTILRERSLFPGVRLRKRGDVTDANFFLVDDREFILIDRPRCQR
jgi:hypothetical protein